LKVRIIHKQPLVTPSLFFESSKKVYFGEARFMSQIRGENGLTTTAEIPLYVTEKKEALRIDNLIGSPIKITLSTHQVGMEQSLLITAPSLPMVERLLMYLFALIGGFILNFMPCVLPVILLKIFSLLKESEHTQHLRTSLAFSVAGMLTSFVALGVVSIIFKKIGYSLGWGLQFQEPFFLYFMMLVLVFFTGNFWGFYEVNLPSRFANIGYDQTRRSGNLGHFMSGMFATFLATPCSAPYLGTAVSFALSRGATEIMLIFLCLGLGLAFPFLLVIAFPRVAAYFPKPGAWMDTFRHILGWGFILTLIWLLYVMSQQLSYKIVLAIALILIAILMLLWAYSRKEILRRFYLVPLCLALAIGVGGGALLEKNDHVSTKGNTTINK
jgi:suppressor for copper-sensitivity B